MHSPRPAAGVPLLQRRSSTCFCRSRLRPAIRRCAHRAEMFATKNQSGCESVPDTFADTFAVNRYLTPFGEPAAAA